MFTYLAIIVGLLGFSVLIHIQRVKKHLRQPALFMVKQPFLSLRKGHSLLLSGEKLKKEDFRNFRYSEEALGKMMDRYVFRERALSNEEKEELLANWKGFMENNWREVNQFLRAEFIGKIVGLQYICSNDERSCRFCLTHHLEIVKITEREKIAKYTPPNHLGCRCLWIPVWRGYFEEKDFHWTEAPLPDYEQITI